MGGGDNSRVHELLNQSILIALPRDPGWRHQVLALTLADLLGRVFPRMGFENADGVDASPHLPPGEPLLRDRLEGVRGNGRVTPLPTSEFDLVVRIGPSEEPADVFVDGYGWQSFIGSQSSQLPADQGALVAVGPLVAACRAAARTFSVALSEFRPPPPVIATSYWSGLTYATSSLPLQEPVPMANVLASALLGAGSIGGASCFLWRHTPELSGALEVIDPQELAPENPDKAILATRELVGAGAKKATVAMDALAHHANLHVSPYVGELSGWAAERDVQDPLPLVMCAVDSIATRRELQDFIPLEVINAACSTDDIAVSGHRTGEGPCVYCLYLSQVLDRDRILAKLIAAETGIDFMTVVRMLVTSEAVSGTLMRQIESRRGLRAGALRPYEGKGIDEVFRSEFLYGEARLRLEEGTEAALPAPFVTALAGFILAAEGLKAGTGSALQRFRLGPRGDVGIKIAESPYQDPANSIISSPSRWPSHECLCRSSRRLRILKERYQGVA